jgi:hypothetical protein
MREVAEHDERSAKRSPASGALALAGLGLVGLSLFMLFSNVQVTGGFFSGFGWSMRDFGWSLLPLLLGVGWIVLQPRSLGGWALAAIGLAILVFEIIGSLTFYFRPVSLVTTLLMLIPGAAGLGLLLKNL